MIRIGIVGSDNSHAQRFPELTNIPEAPPEKHIPGAQVVAIYGRDPARTQEVAQAARIPKIVADPKEMLGQVDAVMVVFRHGGLHKDHALPFIEAGIPTFVDKPLATTPQDAEAIVAAAERTGTPVTSYSTLRYAQGVRDFIAGLEAIAPIRSGIYTSPANRESEYGGLIFYAIHAVELMMAAHGPGIEEVQAVQRGPNVMAILGHKEGALLALNFSATLHGFAMQACGDKGHRFYDVDSSDAYVQGLKVFLEMVRTGKPPIPYAEMVESIRVADAVERSLQTGKAIRL